MISRDKTLWWFPLWSVFGLALWPLVSLGADESDGLPHVGYRLDPLVTVEPAPPRAAVQASQTITLPSRSATPRPRLARQIPREAAERAAARQRHAAALRSLFDASGIPSGSDAPSVEARARAVEAVVAAISNRAEVARGVTADSVAAAVAAVASPTNATHRKETRP